VAIPTENAVGIANSEIRMNSSIEHALAREPADKTSDEIHRNLGCGAMVQMVEMFKGNGDMVAGKSFESVLSDRLSMFNRHPSTVSVLHHSQQSTMSTVLHCTQQSTVSSVGIISSHGDIMIRGGPPLPNCHSKRRLLSSNERMIANLTKKWCCSLCLHHKHQINVCPLLETHQAWLVPWKNVKELAERIGKNLYYEVLQPNEETRSQIESFVVPGNPWNIPTDTCHLVLHQTFVCPVPGQPISCNFVEVSILGNWGVLLPGYVKTYFSVYIIRSWILKNCAVIRRKHHVLSTLQSRTVDRSM
jgi:hypothetical protein